TFKQLALTSLPYKNAESLKLWCVVSKAAADLMAYCDAHTREDPLIVPVPASENPFREKKFFCTIL
uniref:Guanine nucleotide-binding protein subunit gamma n=1 Tax=Fundulus heteroclitus TaxID=8078 RepID=A0A3Q2U0P7_FUNHE